MNDTRNSNVSSFYRFLPVNNVKKLEEKKPEKLANAKSFVSCDNVIPNKTSKTTSFKKTRNDNVQINEHTNILVIDSMIKNKLRAEQDLAALEEKRSRLEWIMENSTDDLECIDAKNALYKVNREIIIIQNGKRLEKYIEQTSKILEQYSQIKSRPKSFVKITNDMDTVQAENQKKQLIDQYLIIAQTFVPINRVHPEKERLSCSNCGGIDFDIVEDNYYACKNCRSCTQLFDDSHSYKDIDRLNLLSRFSYSKEGHFEDVIKKFQGNQNTNIDKEVYDMIERECTRHNIPKSRLTLDNVLLFLQENGFNKYYEDVILIHSRITGTPTPNISKYVEKLLEMNEKAERVFERIKRSNRINALHVHYKLMKLLEILGYKCDRSYFNILKTKDRIDECDEYWEQICEILDWPFHSTDII